jgi:hypothetical protein
VTDARPFPPPARLVAPAVQFRVWHLALLVLYVAVAIVNIQDQRRGEPALIALAASGFAAYGLLGVLAWRFARRLEGRLGPLPLLTLYLVAMAAMFLVATVTYLVAERLYLGYGL